MLVSSEVSLKENFELIFFVPFHLWKFPALIVPNAVIWQDTNLYQFYCVRAHGLWLVFNERLTASCLCHTRTWYVNSPLHLQEHPAIESFMQEWYWILFLFGHAVDSFTAMIHWNSLGVMIESLAYWLVIEVPLPLASYPELWPFYYALGYLFRF